MDDRPLTGEVSNAPDLLECERVVCQHPALITVIATVRTDARVDGAIHEQQTGAVHLVQILECRHRAGARSECGCQLHRPFEFLLPRCHIERLQAMYKGYGPLRSCSHLQ